MNLTEQEWNELADDDELILSRNTGKLNSCFGLIVISLMFAFIILFLIWSIVT